MDTNCKNCLQHGSPYEYFCSKCRSQLCGICVTLSHMTCEIFDQDGQKLNNLNILRTYVKAKINQMNKLEEELNHTKDKMDSLVKLLSSKEAQVASSQPFSMNRNFSFIRKPVQKPLSKNKEN